MESTQVQALTHSSAIARVFHIPELLESILVQLSIKDLLLSQRTSQTFRSTTQGSIRLRRKLFLEPDWDGGSPLFSRGYAPLSRPGRKPDNNRLLLRAFPGCYPTITLVIVSDGSSGGQTRFERAGVATGIGSETWSWDVCISFPADAKPTMSPAVEYCEASWRNMYLSQPPCQSLYLVRRWQRSVRPAMVRENGITMGDFFDEATSSEPRCDDRKWHASYISSDRDWHFEGNIRCSSIEEVTPEVARLRMKELLQDYSYSRMLHNGAVMALSDTWDPGSSVEFSSRAGRR